MSKTSNQRVGTTIEEIHSKLGIDAALKCHTRTYELLSVIPKQALADDLEKSSYKTKQIRASTTRRFLILLIVIIKFIEF